MIERRGVDANRVERKPRAARRAATLVLLTLLLLAGKSSALTVEQPEGVSGDAIGSVKSIIDQTVVVFKQQNIPEDERQKKLRAIAERHFDFSEMAQSSVGYHWRTFAPEQRAEFVPLFTRFIEGVYLSQIEAYSVEKINQQINSTRIRFIRQTIDPPDYAEVWSTVILQDRPEPIAVNYEMRRESGEWKIYDITIDSISVIANYRNQFNRVLNNDGHGQLIELMKRKIQGLQQVAK